MICTILDKKTQTKKVKILHENKHFFITNQLVNFIIRISKESDNNLDMLTFYLLFFFFLFW